MTQSKIIKLNKQYPNYYFSYTLNAAYENRKLIGKIQDGGAAGYGFTDINISGNLFSQYVEWLESVVDAEPISDKIEEVRLWML